MKIEERIINALFEVPNVIALPVMRDVYQRMKDWLVNGGNLEDSYIEQQVRYCESVGEFYKK